MKSKLMLRVLGVCLLVGAVSCSGSKSEPAPAATPQGKKVDAATAGSIAGKVKFEGTPPVLEALHMSKDCAPGPGPNPQNEAILVSADGSLQNTFVYLKDGIDAAYAFDSPTKPVELEQQGCVYRPRVMGVQVGQPIDVVNMDPTLHNVHALPMVNSEFNKHQPQQNQHMTHVFTAPEVMVRFKCDVHPWMASWVGVVAHPFFAVTDKDGRFDMKGVPPGTYTIEAWHEKFGHQATKITIGDHQDQTVDFTFKADSK